MPYPAETLYPSESLFPGLKEEIVATGSTPPSTTLSVSIITASGIYRWGPDEWEAANVPQGISFATAMPGGFKSATITLPRRIDHDYPDLNLLDTVQILGAGNKVAWEGRVEQLPRTHGDTFSITVGAVGWSAHLLDDPSFREIYVDRDLSNWGSMSRARRLADIAASLTPNDGQIAPDSTTAIPGVVLSIPGNASTTRQICEMLYDSGPGIYLGSIYYDFVRGKNSTSSYEAFVASDDSDTFPSSTITGNLCASAESTGTLTAGTKERYGLLMLQTPAGDGGTEGLTHDVTLRRLSVWGAHGLTKQGTAPEDGLYASDVIADVVGRTAPLLSASIQATGFPIPHLIFKDPTTAEDVIKLANGYHLWDWGVYEDRIFFYREPDPGRLTWGARLSEGAQVDLEGSQVSDVYNGVFVSYTDPAGTIHTVGPPGSGADGLSESLQDTSAANPVNAHGIPKKWALLSISQITTEAGAIQLGSIFLGERSLPQRRGTLTLTGTVNHPTAGPLPAWEMRAGDWVWISDHPTDVPRKIIETNYDASTQTIVLSLDNTSQKLDAILERLGVSLIGVL